MGGLPTVSGPVNSPTAGVRLLPARYPAWQATRGEAAVPFALAGHGVFRDAVRGAYAPSIRGDSAVGSGLP